MIELLYLVAAALFIVGLRRLSHPATARVGNALAALGMLVAVVVTLVDLDAVSYTTIVAGMVTGAVIGGFLAQRVAMTAMPQLVASFNGFGGAASAFVALIESGGDVATETGVTIALSVLIGALTLSGSFVAFGKLQGIISGRPLSYPGQLAVNGLVAAAGVAAATWAIATGESVGYWYAGGAALLLGVLAVLPIGGADMPVVISLLNSFSGLAASAAGFVIENSALIVGGALVGAAGFILTVQMSDAMNRTLANVLFSGFGGGEPAAAIGGDVTRGTVDDVAVALAYAQSVMFVPGYGMAVAQAQHAARELADALEARNVTVHYAIHPVAGRMPGHMNVLLAEADVPYDQLLDLDQSNPRLSKTSVAVIVGANDVVNPSARDDPGSPIYGMPILEVDHADTVVVIKRSLSPGFAGIDNPLFYSDRTVMLFADAKQALEDLVAAIKQY